MYCFCVLDESLELGILRSSLAEVSLHREREALGIDLIQPMPLAAPNFNRRACAAVRKPVSILMTRFGGLTQ
jgi:hypothetical protein